MNKQEVIRKAWGDIFCLVEEYLTEDGYALFKDNSMRQAVFWDNGDYDAFDTVDINGYNGESVGIDLFRPKSLKGIEHNNHWIKIESKEDLPQDLTDVFVFDDDGDITQYTFGICHKTDWSLVKTQGITHYTPITKPLKPIY